MAVAATRAEDAAPAVPIDIDQEVTELQQSRRNRHRYHRSLQDVVEEYRGDMEDVLLRIMANSVDRAGADVERLREPLMKTVRKDRFLINRVVRLYWDRSRLDAAKAAHKKRHGTSCAKDVEGQLSRDYEDLMLALVGDN